MVNKAFIHSTARVSEEAQIGDGTYIWDNAQVREHATIGSNCRIGKGVYIDHDVTIGNNVKIQNYSSIYHGVTIKDGVFIGPHVSFTNDKFPRAINPDGSIKDGSDWSLALTIVEYGASLGACSVILPGIVIGRFAAVGAGSVVTKSIEDYILVCGNPARFHSFICECGRKMDFKNCIDDIINVDCKDCSRTFKLNKSIYQKHLYK